MCGIAGYIGAQPLSPKHIARTLAVMKNRGPDFQDSRSFVANNNNVSLLHSRLSIIDLDPRSNQPFSIGGASIVFNGEIYNYRELRETLHQKNIPLYTESDTEILLQYYLLYGEQCVTHFEGMWSFAIYDTQRSLLFLSRDRFGEKPLYYTATSSGFWFGSEIKFLMHLCDHSFSTNFTHLSRYLVNGFRSLYKTQDTFYSEVQELPRATNLLIDSHLKKQQSRYWTPMIKEVTTMTSEEAVEGFKERFLSSIALRLRSDVPLAFCLSGGVDSASIVSVAQKQFDASVATFSIVDPDLRYNEQRNIQATIDDLHCKHCIIELKKEHFLERLKKLITYHDSPLATISYYVHSLLCEQISKEGYRVSLAGTGADELLAGYYDHFLLHLYEMREHPQFQMCLAAWEKHIKPLVRNPYLQFPDLYIKNPQERRHLYLDNEIFSSWLTKPFFEPFVEEACDFSLLRNRMQNELFHEIVPVILHEDDLNSMMYSIENRSPFLDSKLYEFCFSIPPQHLVVDGYGKFVLRESMKGILNEQVRTDRKKVGFNAGINSLIDFSNSEVQEFLLAPSPIFEIVNRDCIRPLFKKNPLPDTLNKFMFNFINAKLFLEGLR